MRRGLTSTIRSTTPRSRATRKSLRARSRLGGSVTRSVLGTALVFTNGVVHGWSADRKQSTSAVTTTVNSLLSNAPPFLPFFASAQSYASSDSTPIASESTSQNDVKMFREHGCELPANAMFEHTNTRYPQAIRCVRLPSELREPIEKSACLATIVRATAYLVVWGNGTSPQESDDRGPCLYKVSTSPVNPGHRQLLPSED